MAERITSWSYSRYGKHENCAQSAYYTYVDKHPDPAGPAAARGTGIHKEAEDFVGGDIEELPESLIQFENEFFELRDDISDVHREEQWGFSAGWRKASWKKAWARMVLDAHYVVGKEGTAIDYKTGKIRSSHGDQMELYAVGMFIRYPKIKTVAAKLWYLDHGVIDAEVFSREIFDDLKEKWSAKVAPLLSDTTFAPNPGRFPCAWCGHNVNAGGPCEAGEPFRMEK